VIRLRTAARVMPAFWLAIPVCVLAALYVTLFPISDGYGTDATATGTATLPFVGALCAACAAWEGSRLRRARVWGAPSVRSRVEIALWSILPAVLAGSLAIGVAVGVQLLRSAAGLPDVRLIGVAVLDLVAYASAGFAAGVLLPFAVAGPLAIVATMFWLAFVPAMDPVWMRHLTGMFRDCCMLQSDLAPGAAIASTMVNLGIIAAAALLVSGLAPGARRAGAAVALSSAALVGVLFVGSMTYSPTVPRDPSGLLCRVTGGTTVCVWPEHENRLDEVARIVADVRAGWQRAGMTVPSHFTEADPNIAPEEAVAFGFNGRLSTRDIIIGDLARGALPEFPDCPGGYTGSIAFEYLEAWYAATGGMSADEMQERYTYPTDPFPSVSSVLDQLHSASPEVRRNWIARAEDVSQACDEWPADLIAVER